MKRPTERQRELLDLIHVWWTKRGYGPSVRELRAGLGLRSTNGVSEHLAVLEHKRLVERDRNIARSTRLTARGESAIGVRRCHTCGAVTGREAA